MAKGNKDMNSNVFSKAGTLLERQFQLKGIKFSAHRYLCLLVYIQKLQIPPQTPLHFHFQFN